MMKARVARQARLWTFVASMVTVLAACQDKLSPVQSSSVAELRPVLGHAMEDRRLPQRDLPAQRLAVRVPRPDHASLRKSLEASNGHALVGLKAPGSARAWDSGELAPITRKEIEEALRAVELIGPTITKSFAFRPLLALRLSEGHLERLLASDHVDYIEADVGGRLEGNVARTLPLSFTSGQDTSWALQRVGAPSAWTQNQGQAVTVTMLDAGLDYTHTIAGDGPASLGMCLYDATIPGDEPGCNAPSSGGLSPQAHASFVAGLVNASDNS